MPSKNLSCIKTLQNFYDIDESLFDGNLGLIRNEFIIYSNDITACVVYVEP